MVVVVVMIAVLRQKLFQMDVRHVHVMITNQFIHVRNIVIIVADMLVG